MAKRNGWQRNYREDSLIAQIDRGNTPRKTFRSLDAAIAAAPQVGKAAQVESRPNSKCLRRRLVDAAPQLTLPFK